jgi:hypothetical protein
MVLPHWTHTYQQSISLTHYLDYVLLIHTHHQHQVITYIYYTTRKYSQALVKLSLASMPTSKGGVTNPPAMANACCIPMRADAMIPNS